MTSRAKSATRLEPKVRQRATRKTYATVDDIYADIADLAGARVALYFPEQRAQVDALIRQLFTVSATKTFPEAGVKAAYEKRFEGYSASHYRVQLRDTSLSDAQKRYGEARIEIQVASVLMHAWSEVEHDLVYKPLQGKLSGEEYDILDELNGLVIAGEIALKRLQSAGQNRVKGGRGFANHYELAAFLLANASAVTPAPAQGLGGVDTLYQFLIALNMSAPGKLEPYLEHLHADLERRPISEQIIDQLLAEDEARYGVYQKVRAASVVDDAAAEQPDVHEALGYFLSQWIDYERSIRGRMQLKTERGPPVPSPSLLRSAGLIDGATEERLEPIRRLRNNVVHGAFAGQPHELRDAGDRLREIVQGIRLGPVG